MRTVYACSLGFNAPIDAIWDEATAWVKGWYEKRFPDARLPQGWIRGTSEPLAPLQKHSLEVACSRSAGPGEELREIRWRYPDQYDSSLLWASDVGVYTDATETLFTIAVRVASFDFELLPAKFQLGTPGIVRKLVARGDARVGSKLLPPSFQRLEAADIPALVGHLLDASRRIPVVVLTADPFTDRFTASPTTIAATLAGTATVVALGSKWAAFALTEELGKQFSCFSGAVRIYWPRFSSQADPYLHRLWVPDDVIRAERGQGFAVELLRAIAPAAAFRFVEPQPIRSFRARVEQQRLATLKAEMSKDYNEVFALWDQQDKVIKDLTQKNIDLTSENATFRENLNAVWTVAPRPDAEAGAAASDSGVTEVASVVSAVEEAKRLTKYLHFLPDASESAKESPFKQPQKALTALLAIDEIARGWLLSVKGLKAAFKELGFDYADDISQTTRGKWGREYVYKYEGKETSFEPHITIGAKQADKCLSIHMHWDEQRGRVVIAHVGRHKTNTKS